MIRDARELSQAVGCLRSGGIIAHATEYCFGLTCDPGDIQAVYRLLRIKRRAPSKGLILIAATIDQLRPYVEEFPSVACDTWPGPFTWLLRPRDGVPKYITGHHSGIAVRVTGHAQAASLCLRANMALISTSANRAGERPARHTRQVRDRLGGVIDYVLPGRVGGLRSPTGIRDAYSMRIIRPQPEQDS